MERKTAVPPATKEKLSRLNKRHRKESRKKRRIVIALVAVVVCVLAVGAVLDIPYMNIARKAGSWVGSLFESSQDNEEPHEDFLYFRHPQSPREFAGEVSVLLGIYMRSVSSPDARDIIYLALFSYDREAGTGEVYIIPETSAAYNAAGQQTSLKWALLEEGGEDLLLSTVGNLSGNEVDYLVLLEFREAVRLVQELWRPAITLEAQTVLFSPLNGETNLIQAGQQIRDSDRILFFMLATEVPETWPAFAARLQRAQEYLPGVLRELSGSGPQELEGMLSSLGEDYVLQPGTGSPEEDGRYLASMLQSFVSLPESALAVKAVPAVEVLNGCGVPDLGKKVGVRLSSLGVPVAGTGANAKAVVNGEEVNDFTHEVSTIVCRSEDPRVQAFASYLGVLLSVKDVVTEPGPGEKIVLIAGRDLAV